jgi:uncharacterized phage-associated protein
MWFLRRSASHHGEAMASPNPKTNRTETAMMNLDAPATATAPPQPSATVAPVRAADVAKYLVKKSEGGMEQLKLQKLLYFCQAGSLAWLRRVLFDDPIEAWASGPVVVSLWRNHRYEGFIRDVTEGRDLEDEDARTIADSIYAHYGHLAPEVLTDLTHEQPWIEARKKVSVGEPGRVLIEPSAIESFYREKWPQAAAS